MNIVTASFNMRQMTEMSHNQNVSEKKKNRAPEQWYNMRFEPRGKT